MTPASAVPVAPDAPDAVPGPLDARPVCRRSRGRGVPGERNEDGARARRA